MRFNANQRELLNTYEDGAYAHLVDVYISEHSLRFMDTSLGFMINHLFDTNVSVSEAASRLLESVSSEIAARKSTQGDLHDIMSFDTLPRSTHALYAASGDLPTRLS